MSYQRKKARKARQADAYDATASYIRGIPSKTKTKRDSEFRPSVYQGINPRSETYVRRGTAPERIAVPLAAGTAGGIVLPYGGAVVGGTYGRTRNLKKDNTRSYHRKTGKPATAYLGGVDAGGYLHQNPKDFSNRAKKIRREYDIEQPVKKSHGVSAFGVVH
jgi:hypothetical protein